MPYKLRKKGAQICVIKDTGEEVHCHGTRSQAVAQMRALYASEGREVSEKEVETNQEFYCDAGLPMSESDLSVYKEGEVWRWHGVYSNNQPDRAIPPDTLTPAAHKSFAYLVEQDLIAKPPLLAWHFDQAEVGYTDRVYYDEATGLAHAEGGFHADKAHIAQAWSTRTDLGMSHRMPLTHLHRHPDQPGLIEKYISTEFTGLPRQSACNELTGLAVTKEVIMRQPNEQERQFLKESGWSDDDINSFVKKEVTALEKEETSETQAETKPAPVLDPVPTAPPAVLDTTALDDSLATLRTEIATTLKELIGPVQVSLQSLTTMVAAHEATIAALQHTDTEKVQKAIEGTPRASLSDLLKGFISTQETCRVDGRTKEGSDGPVQNKPKPTTIFEALRAGTDWRETIGVKPTTDD